MKVIQLDSVSFLVQGGGGEYLVWKSKGRWTCDCEGFQYYGLKPDFKCKHIKHVEGLKDGKG